MKFLIAVIFVGLLFACNQTVTKPYHLVSYVDNIALNNTGWDNNEMTKNDFQEKLSKSFNKNLADSNLLEGFPLKVFGIIHTSNDSSLVTFQPALITKDAKYNSQDKTEINFRVISNLPDSLAKTLNDNQYYYITGYSKTALDSSYEPDILVSPMANASHTIYTCYLGLHHITITKIEPANP